MKTKPIVAILLASAFIVSRSATSLAGDVSSSIEAARALRDAGHFTSATALLKAAIDSVSSDTAKVADLEFEIERIRRTRLDYTITRPKLLGKLQSKLKEFTQSELDQHLAAGIFDRLVIDGEERFTGTTPSNLVWRYPELEKRLVKPSKGSPTKIMTDLLRAAHRARLDAPKAGPLVTPRDYEATFTITLLPNTVPAGQRIRVWLPYPQSLPSQTDIHLISTDPPGGFVAPEGAAHRTVYLERMSVADTTMTFRANFGFQTTARVFLPEEAAVSAFPKASPAWRDALASRPPHLNLADAELRRITSEAIGDTTNPLQKVRRIHRWMIDHLIYQYAREYSTIDAIARYCHDRKGGDCGQHSMLFIAMCRIAGVPARWTTGWEMFEPNNDCNMHDWTEVWIEPYGWIPVDTDMAIVASKHSPDVLSDADRQWVADFLVGNMDGARLIVNTDYGQPLIPAKDAPRSETVDFQRGEVEANGKNLYFDQWDYKAEIRPVR